MSLAIPEKFVLGGSSTVPLHERFTQILEAKVTRPLVLTCHLDLQNQNQNLALLMEKHTSVVKIEKSVKQRLGRANTWPRLGMMSPWARRGVRWGARQCKGDLRGLRYPSWYLRWKYGWTVKPYKRTCSWRGGGLAPAGSRGRGPGRRGAWRRAAVLTREELDAQLEDYMSKSKSRLDAELDEYMSMPGDCWQ